IVSFTDNGIVKDNVSFYSKLSKLFSLFSHLEQKAVKTKKNEALPLFDLLFKSGSIPPYSSNSCLIQLFATGASLNKDDKDRVTFQRLIERFLNFQPLHDIYLTLQFNLLSMSNEDKIK